MVDVRVTAGNVLEAASELCVYGVFQDQPLHEAVRAVFEAGDFAAGQGQTLLLYPRGAVAPGRLLLVGLGESSAVRTDHIRQAAATAIRQAQALKVAQVTVGIQPGDGLAPAAAVQAFAEGVVLGAYQFERYFTDPARNRTFAVERATIYTETGDEADLGASAGLGVAIARGAALARDLVNGPGYAMTPAALGDEALALGERLGLTVTVFDQERLRAEGFGGILAVGQGSANPPCFIVMEHGKAEAGKPTICLVGKGLTFDSGGLSLKPADAMETMKSDMGGAAAVFGAMQVVAELGLPLHVVGLVSAAENMPSSTAYRPGDVVRTLSGKTVEVLNTDAEGRIILSDALFYAQRYEPTAIVELSTLTGAIIIALGAHAIGLMATDQALAERVIAAGEASDERVWQLPMWDEYHQMIKSKIADLKNLGGRPAGSITAGAFLAAFVGDIPFAHLDIAGTAWVDSPAKPYQSVGGTGVGVRLLTAFLQAYAG
jgi:leucyl aminopeptidase